MLVFGMWNHLVDLKLVQIMTIEPKWHHPRDHMFYIGLYRENKKKIFLSEATKPRALMFGM